MASDADVLVVGGGISGLAIAAVLANGGTSVQLWEASRRPGGKIQTDTHAGYVTDRGACMVLNFRPEVSRFLGEFGMASEKLFSPAAQNRYLAHDGRLVAVPMRPGKLLRCPLWSTRAKLRLALEPLIPRGGHQDETVSEFITRRLGKEALESAFDPYLAGPLASDPDRANAWSALPRLTALERRYGSLTLGAVAHRVLRRATVTVNESFSFHGGMETLTDRLADTPGVTVRTNCRVVGIGRDKDGWILNASSPQGPVTLSARQVVLSVPAGEAARLLSHVDKDLARLLGGIQYAPVVVVNVGFDRDAVSHSLDGKGFLVPRREHLALNGCLWTSSLFPGRVPAGKVLLTNYLGGARQPNAIDWDDRRCMSEVLSNIGPLLHIRGDPEMVRIDRHAQGLPLYHGRYYQRLRDIEARVSQLPGLSLEANYLGGVSVRDRITRAYAVAERIRQDSAGTARETQHQAFVPMMTRARMRTGQADCQGIA